MESGFANSHHRARGSSLGLRERGLVEAGDDDGVESFVGRLVDQFQQAGGRALTILFTLDRGRSGRVGPTVG